MKGVDEFFPDLMLRERVLKLMESGEDFGGPQSVDDLCKSLGISNGSSRSVLVKLHQAGKIERLSKGVYALPDESRAFKKTKSHLK